MDKQKENLDEIAEIIFERERTAYSNMKLDLSDCGLLQLQDFTEKEMDKQDEELLVFKKCKNVECGNCAYREVARGERAMVDLLNQEMEELQDEQKDLEEMIGIIQNAVGGCAKHWAELIAVNLRKNDYRKIPENAVVLTMEEREEFNELYRSALQRAEKWEKLCGIKIKETRKETAEKFAEKVNQAIVDNTYPYFDKDGKPVNIWKATMGFDKIDEICKEFTGGKNGQ